MRPQPPEGTADYYAWRLGFESVDAAIDFLAWSTEHADWGEGHPTREREKWHERTTRRLLLAVIKERKHELSG